MKSYVPFLSLRYLWFHKVSSGLGILGVTLGVGLVIVVVGVMDGFQTRIRRSLIGNTAALVVRIHYDVDAEALVEALKKVPGVLEASPVVYQPTLVAPPESREGDMLPCRIVGIDPAREDRISDLRAKLRWGKTPDSPYRLVESASPEKPFQVSELERAMNRRDRPEKQGVLLSKKVLGRLGVSVGQAIQVFTAHRKKEQAGGRPKEVGLEQELFTVTGAFDSDSAEVDRDLILMDRRDALSFFRDWIPQETEEVRLLLADPIERQSESLVRASLKKGGRVGGIPLLPLTWKDVHRELVRAVDNERGLLLVIASFTFIVVAFLIGSTQSMLVVEKTREIGVLRSLGASVAGTSSVFLANGLFIGTAGALGGWGVGVAVTSHIEEIRDFISRVFHRDLLPQDIYSFREVPVDVRPDFVLAVCLGAVAFALLGSILPAVRAAMLDPVESLHHE